MQTSPCFGFGVQPFFITVILLSCIALVTTSIIAVAYNYIPVRSTESAPAGNTTRQYSFIGEDYPMYYPLDVRNVFLVLEDTVHYGITGPHADEEWESLFPPGQGFVCLGPNKTKFGLALYHEMHCLDLIRRGIGKNNYNPHKHHCINYLRQAILCEADTTIEPVEPRLGSDSVVTTRVQRMCKDWSQVYDEGTKGACGK